MSVKGQLESILHIVIILIQGPKMAEQMLSEVVCIVWGERRKV